MDFPEIGWVTVLAAAVAAVRSASAGRRATGTERLAWVWLAAGAGLAAAAEILRLAARRQGIDLAQWTAAEYAAWASLYYLVVLAYLAAAWLQPHRPAAQPVRASRLIDTLLRGLLLFVIHYYYLVAYRLSGEAVERRLGGSLWILLLSGVAGAGLLRRRSRTASPRWRRIYGLLAGAVLVRGAGEAVYVWARDPRESWPAGVLEVAGYVLLAWAARPDAVPAAIEESPGEIAAGGGWRDLLVPAVVLGGLAGIPLGERLFPVPVQSPAQAMVLFVALDLYIILILLRQFVVQMENRTLSRNLQQESIRLRLLVDNIRDAVVTEDLAGRIIFANDRFLELFAASQVEVLGRRLQEFIVDEDRPLGRNRPDYRSSGVLVPIRIEFRGRRRGGAVLYLESSMAPVRVGGLLLGYQSVIRDITERRQAEERQRELVQRLEFFVNHMPLACIVFDLDFRIIEWNHAATQIFGWTAEEAFGRYGLELLAPQEAWPAILGIWEEMQQNKTATRSTTQNLTKDRGHIECEWFNTSLIDQSGRVVAIASMTQDVSERKSLEAQLRQSQKMEAVGVLAGGVAHDFNNLLTIILGNIAMAQLRVGAGHAAEKGLRDAERAAERAAELVRQLLGFSRKSRSEPRPTSLHACVEETLALVRSTLDRRVVLDVKTAPDLWPVEADPSQMHQVLVNLIVNSRDAMLEGGNLTIRTANRSIDEPYCRTHPDARLGEFVEVAVSDTGHGMDAATAARIFEPFFTTKELGKGTGLGLAMVYGIVKQHGGWVTVESEPGRGTTFRILLPRTRARTETPPQAPAGASVGGSETILLVDDEEMIVRLGRAILESNGHRVLEARDGEEALQVFRSHQPQIDLVVLDMIMPRKSGRDTLEELHRLAPQVPVVLASGYALVGSDELLALGAKAYIHKPYRPTELAHTIRHVLDTLSATRTSTEPRP